MPVVFIDIPRHTSTINVRETQAIAEAARLFGCRVFHIPSDFDECGTAENALAYVPEFEVRQAGVWSGFIPTHERYEAIYQAALQKNIRLVNSPEQYRRAMEFDRFYPLLDDLTPRSVIIEDVSQISSVASEIGYPVFVKGAVKSDKEAGWKAVVAENETELHTLASRLLAQPVRLRGKVIVRELVQLNNLTIAPNGFPIAREYRIFLYRGEMQAYGFYQDIDPVPLTHEEETRVLRLAREAARRVGTPYLAVDVAQLETGDWIVIEVGDAQFCGLSHVPVLELWSRVKDFTLPETSDTE